MARTYRDLLVWQKAKALTLDVYRQTARFPRSEIYGLTSQIRRAALSVVSNIAEGQGRITSGKFRQFLGHSRGSLLELETQLEIACELGFLKASEYEILQRRTYEVLGLINRLLASLRPTAGPPTETLKP